MIHSSEILDNNGTEVSIQGLTSTPIEVAFPEQAKGALISITISTVSGTILYHEKTEKEVLDYSALQLPKGEKTLLIEIGNESVTIVFN